MPSGPMRDWDLQQLPSPANLSPRVSQTHAAWPVPPSQAALARPDRFLNPSTATERRTGMAAIVDCIACFLSRYHHIVAPRSRATVLATNTGHSHLFRNASGAAPVLSLSRSER